MQRWKALLSSVSESSRVLASKAAITKNHKVVVETTEIYPLTVLEAAIKIKMSAGPCSLCRLSWRVLPRLFHLLVAPDIPWVATATLSSLSLLSYGVLHVCVSFCLFSPLLIETLVMLD